jgi:adenylate cyclase
MMALADRAVALNPNSARSWALSAYLRIWAGQLEIAMEHHEISDRLSPRARVGTSAAAMGGIHFLARRFDKAMPKLLLAIQEDPSAPQFYRYLSACYAHMGRLDEAREIIGRLRAIAPVVISDVSYMRNREQRELLLSGLRLAMGEAAEPDRPLP